MPNRYVLAAAQAGGPCSTSETHSSPGAAASNRPNRSLTVPVQAGQARSIRTKCRWMVRTEGTCPAASRAARTRVTWAAVRSGFSFFSATASSSTPAPVRGATCQAARDQGVEPAGRPQPDPPVQGGPADAHRLPGRVLVLAGGQLADQQAALPRRQARVRGGADHRVPEQGDIPRPGGPGRQLVLISAHRHLHQHRTEATETPAGHMAGTRCRDV